MAKCKECREIVATTYNGMCQKCYRKDQNDMAEAVDRAEQEEVKEDSD